MAFRRVAPRPARGFRRSRHRRKRCGQHGGRGDGGHRQRLLVAAKCRQQRAHRRRDERHDPLAPMETETRLPGIAGVLETTAIPAAERRTAGGHQCRIEGAPGGRRRPGGRHQGDLRRAGRECRALGRGGAPLCRFRRRHRGDQHRPPAPEGDCGGGGAGAGLHAYLRARVALRELRRAGGAAERAGAGGLPEEDAVPVDRRRGGGERYQDRALRHRTVGDHRLLRGLPRPHDDGDGADRQGDALQEGLRTVPGRRLPLDLPARLPRADAGARTGRPGAAAGD